MTYRVLALILCSVSYPIALAGPVSGEEGMGRKLRRREGAWDLQQCQQRSFIQ